MIMASHDGLLGPGEVGEDMATVLVSSLRGPQWLDGGARPVPSGGII
jgi:hypothetical protein